MTHDELAADLAAHCRSTYAMVWTDMQLGPAASPRPDVYVVPPSYARFDPVAYEVKISIADARSDFKTGKWQNYYAFATRIYMAAPAGLLKRDDLPPGLGLIVRGPEGWRVTKAPRHQRLEKGTLPHDAWIKLLLDGLERIGDRTAKSIKNRGTERWCAESKAARDLLGHEVALALQNRLDARRHLEEAQLRDTLLAKELADRRDATLERAERDARREAQHMDERRANAARAAGLEESATWGEVFARLHQLQDELRRDERIVRAARYFQSELARVLPELAAEEVA